MNSNPSNPDPSAALAAERTLLAWVRTGISLMGFGFVVARFGLFLRELQFIRQGFVPQTPEYSVWFGVSLVFLGAGVNAAAAAHYSRLIRVLAGTLQRASWAHRFGVAVALVLAVLGAAMGVYLLVVR